MWGSVLVIEIQVSIDEEKSSTFSLHSEQVPLTTRVPDQMSVHILVCWPMSDPSFDAISVWEQPYEVPCVSTLNSCNKVLQECVQNLNVS